MSGRCVLLCVFGAVLLAGCGGSSAVPKAKDVTGRFAGHNDDDIGVAVDFGAFDATTEAIRASLNPKVPWTVGSVSVVNRAKRPQPIPAMWITRPGGRVERLIAATTLLNPGAQEVQRLEPPGPFVPALGALSFYVVFRGRPLDARRLEIRVGTGPVTELSPQELTGPPGGDG